MSTQKNALLLLGLPFIVALLTATLVLASETGHLSTWRPLGRPPGTVSMLTARFNSVWATLDDGTVYSHVLDSHCSEACWYVAAEIPPFRPDGYVSDLCHQPYIGYNVRFFTSECISMEPAGIRQTVYALRRDGSVWAWQSGFGGEWALVGGILIVGLGALAGLVMALLILLGLFARRVIARVGSRLMRGGRVH